MSEPVHSSRRRLLVVAATCLLLGALGGVLAAVVAEPPTSEPVRFIPPEEPARDFRLRDQDGRWTTIAGARGNVVALTFLYSTCRDLCPAQANVIADAVGRVKGRVLVYGVSVDPVGDTPQRVRAWLKQRGLYGGPVRFLVGSRGDLAPVWRAYGIVPINATPQDAAAAAVAADRIRRREVSGEAGGGGGGQPEYTHPTRSAPEAAKEPYPDAADPSYRGRPRHKAGLDFEHSAYVMLIDKHGRQRVGFPFEQLDAAALAKDMRLLLQEP